MNTIFVVGMISDELICDVVRGKTEIKVNINSEGNKIPVKVVGKMALTLKEYCSRGDIIGVKGKLVSNGDIYVLADKISFLSRKDDNNGE